MNISADLIDRTDLNSSNSNSTKDFTTPIIIIATKSTKSPRDEEPCINNIIWECFNDGECYTKSYIDGSGNIIYTPFCMYVFYTWALVRATEPSQHTPVYKNNHFPERPKSKGKQY